MKKVILLLFIVLLSTTLVSCSHIDDSNGESNYDLVTITNEDILSKRINSVRAGSIETQSGRTITKKVNKFSGVEDVQSFKLNKGAITFNVSIEVTAGNFKAVLIQDGKIIKEFTNNMDNQIFTVKEGTGIVTFRVAGESAKYKLELEYDN